MIKIWKIKLHWALFVVIVLAIVAPFPVALVAALYVYYKLQRVINTIIFVLIGVFLFASMFFQGMS